ncbi:MAG: hypothetical protein H0T89_20970 [Deltaproteobacteria bacterium]|nr:hypothetical protein [Deltaproteobacteria bacterium]MDQ3297125.1 hypothetical protein [Myxococcota bacterium]
MTSPARIGVLAMLASLALGACETPPLKITYKLANGATQTQSCGSASCSDIKLACDAVLNIRILDPGDPTAPYLSLCEPIPPSRNGLCAISNIDLSDMPIELPKRTLEVQIMIWPRDMVTDPITGELDCRPFVVKFDATAGFPLDQEPTPAMGGRAYYQPGDAETTVTLGCTNLELVNSCAAPLTVRVSATVDAFENLGVSVGANFATRLSVDVGIPKQAPDGTYELNPLDTRRLSLTGTSTPAWNGDVDLKFADTACLLVLENAPQATTAVTCQRLTAPSPNIEFSPPGIYASRATLQQILSALALASFPDDGLTVGIVVDSPLVNPKAGETVSVTDGTVRYLSADRTSFSGTATSTSGIFVSQDAPYGSMFSVNGSLAAPKLGGRIEGKVTIVVLQLAAGE